MSRSNIPDRLRVPHDSYEAEILRRIWDRLHERNEHFMGAIVGEEGSGKSHTGIRIAKVIDPTFTHERVIFDIVELLKILRDGDHKPGYMYVLDEAGVAFGNRTWQDRGQILANQALQLIRSHNIGLLFTLPRLGELDSQTKGRLQAFFEITKKRPGEFVEGKWKYIDPDRSDYTGDIYTPFPTIWRNGMKVKVKRLRFGPPDADLYEPYEQAKHEYQDEVYQNTIDELEDVGEEEEEEKNPREIATEIAKDGVEKYVSRHGQTNQPYINGDLLRAERELSHSDARAVKSLLEQQFDKSDLEEKANVGTEGAEAAPT